MDGEAVGQGGDEAIPGVMVRRPFVQQDERATAPSSPEPDRLAVVGLDDDSLRRPGHGLFHYGGLLIICPCSGRLLLHLYNTRGPEALAYQRTGGRPPLYGAFSVKRFPV
jgi:hypothetical protein